VSAAHADKPVVAAFDFDGTLTRHDTLLPFLRFLFGDARVMRHALAIAPTLAGYGLGLIPNGAAKERVFAQCLTGMELDALRLEAERFARLVLPGLLRHEALQRLDWHKRQGHRCVVISASLDLYVRPWAQQAGFSDIIATHLEAGADGRITGRLSGLNCFGAEKVRRLEALLGGRDGYILYAYGDSRGDRELLALADHAYFRMMPNDHSASSLGSLNE
jgi:phosphatidylglycerophosphatase C